MVRLAPAKVNLTLAVLGIRPDGYHELHSVMVPLDLADRLSVSVLPSGGTDSLHVDGFDPGPVADNLVLRAFAAARRHARPAWGRAEPPPALAARLEKRIPVAAGLAGGSSDAAAAVDAALDAWGVELDAGTRHRVAAELGSDVPFFLAGGPALVEGRGERLAPLGWLREASGSAGPEAPGPRDGPALLLVTPAVAISTPAVFRAWDAGARVGGGAARLASAHLADELRRGHPGTGPHGPGVGAGRGQRPGAGRERRGAGARALQAGPAAAPRAPVGLSGSGPTFWAIYASHAEAAAAADRVRAAIDAGEISAPVRARRSWRRPGSWPAPPSARREP